MSNPTPAGIGPTTETDGMMLADELEKLLAEATPGTLRHEYLGGSSTILAQTKPPRNDIAVPYGYDDAKGYCIAYPFRYEEIGEAPGSRTRLDFVSFSHGDAALIVFLRNNAALFAKLLRLMGEAEEVTRGLMGWIDNWSPNFTEDDEWPATETKARTLLAKIKAVGG